jgi:GDP-L-fucose synthase
MKPSITSNKGDPMKILLTGSNGMVGRNLLEHPLIERHEVLTPSSKELNLLDYEQTNTYLRIEQPELIIHAAGRVGGIQANIREPVKFLTDNLDMGRNIVLAARQNKIYQLLNLGSSCMYPRNARNPLKEEMVLQGELEPTNEGYAIAKITTAKLCEYIARENPMFQYKTLIPCNLYGRWDKFDPQHSHMVPAVIKRIHEAKMNAQTELEIWGDGTARREFMYAGDLADCILHAISKFESLPPLMNVGLGRDYTINEYYQVISEVIGYRDSFRHDLTKPTGMQQKLVDNSRMLEWGWAPQISLHEGIHKTYEFYLDMGWTG